MSASSIATGAFIVNYHQTAWQIKKQDKEAKSAVVEKYQTDPGAVKVEKFLIDKNAPEIRMIGKLAGEARLFHYKNTLPYADNGRLLPAANYEPYKTGMTERKIAYFEAVDHFCTRYEALIDEYTTKLGNLKNRSEYPSITEIRDKFGFDVSFNPVPDITHFTISWLDEMERKAIISEALTRKETAEKEAMADLWKRLYKPVSHMAEKLSDPEGIFQDSLVENIAELVDLLPRLDFSSDPALTRMTDIIKERLLKYDPKTLRLDKAARKETAETAKTIAAGFKKMGKDKIEVPRPAMTIVGGFTRVGTVIM